MLHVESDAVHDDGACEKPMETIMMCFFPSQFSLFTRLSHHFLSFDFTQPRHVIHTIVKCDHYYSFFIAIFVLHYVMTWSMRFSQARSFFKDSINSSRSIDHVNLCTHRFSSIFLTDKHRSQSYITPKTITCTCSFRTCVLVSFAVDINLSNSWILFEAEFCRWLT